MPTIQDLEIFLSQFPDHLEVSFYHSGEQIHLVSMQDDRIFPIERGVLSEVERSVSIHFKGQPSWTQ